MTELDGTPVRDAADLQLRLALLRIGEVAEFAVSRPGRRGDGARRDGGTRAGRALQMMPHQESASETAPRSNLRPRRPTPLGRPAALLKTPCTVRGMRGAAVHSGAAGPAATGTRRLAGPRREAQDELGCGEKRVAQPSGAPAGSICAALREALKAATVLIEGDDPRIKH